MQPRRPTLQQLDQLARERDRELMYTHAQRTGYRDPVVWLVSQLETDSPLQQLHQPLTRGSHTPGEASDEIVFHHNHIFRQWQIDWTEGTQLHVTLVDSAEQARLLAAGDATCITHATTPEVSQRDLTPIDSHSSWHTHAFMEQRRAGAAQTTTTTTTTKITVVQAVAGQWVFEFHRVGRPDPATPLVHKLKLKVARRRLSTEEWHQEQHKRLSDCLTVREAAERAQEARLNRELRAHSAASTFMDAARTSSKSSTKEQPPAQPAVLQQSGELKRSAKRALPVVVPTATPASPVAKKRRTNSHSEPRAVEQQPAPAAYVPQPFIPTARSELEEEF